MNVINLVFARPAMFEQTIENTKELLECMLPTVKIEIKDDIVYPDFLIDEKLDNVCIKGAKYCCDHIHQPVITARTGISIKSLKGFPGFATRYVLRTIGIEGIITLMKSKKNREIQWLYFLAFCKPGSEPKLFKGITNGTIPLNSKGDKGFAFDKIIIPDGYETTFAETPDLKKQVGARYKAIKVFAEWYNNLNE
jgi:non-canonical purine NTP pyrophosphatase (RdgB/HAM1 family)